MTEERWMQLLQEMNLDTARHNYDEEMHARQRHPHRKAAIIAVGMAIIVLFMLILAVIVDVYTSYS